MEAERYGDRLESARRYSSRAIGQKPKTAVVNVGSFPTLIPLLSGGSLPTAATRTGDYT